MDLFSNKIGLILFTLLLLTSLVLLGIVQIDDDNLNEQDKKYKKPLASMMLIFFSRWCLDIGLIEKSHIPALKTILLKVLFPIFAFNNLTTMKRQKFANDLILSALGLINNLIVFSLGSFLIYYCLHKKCKMLTRSCTLAAMFEVGSLAPGTTVYPFVTAMGKNFKNIAFMCDFGNKIWTLLIIAIIIGKATGGNIPLSDLLFKISKMPIVIAFITSIIFICAGINMETDARITSEFAKMIGNCTNPFMLIFIGLKLTIPNKNKIQVFGPIFLRRTLSQLMLVLYQLIFKFSKDDFRALLIFFNAANSIWPYVHMQTILPNPKDKSIVDCDYLLDLIIYDYTFAVFFNMFFSTFHVYIWEAVSITCVYAFLTITFVYLTLSNKTNEVKRE